MTSKGGGGAATNAGVEYQQQVAAWLLVAMDQGFDVAPAFGLPVPVLVDKLSFECREPIDDLNAHCRSGAAVRLQIKRKLSLSEKTDSDFVSVVDQFVAQYLKGCRDRDYFGLVTSGETSSKVRLVLKRLLDKLRLDDDAFDASTLNHTEAEVVGSFRSVVRSRFKAHSGEEFRDDELGTFAKHVFVCQVDAGQGQPHEQAALCLLAASIVPPPEMVWSVLVRWSLGWAAQRAVVDHAGIQLRLAQYRKSSRNVDDVHHENDVGLSLKDAIGADQLIPSGRELVLVEWSGPGADLAVLEFFRFDDECLRRVDYRAGHIHWEKDKAVRSRVLARAATWVGLERLLEESEELTKGKTVGIIPARYDEDLDASECALAHASVCADRVRSKTNLELCVHCGRAINTVINTLVELDDDDTEPDIGLVHDECLRPTDRVLGVIQIPGMEDFERLAKFDVIEWCKRRPKGQLLFNSLEDSTGPFTASVMTIGWNPENASKVERGFCVGVHLSDGQVRHLTSRGRLDRFDRPTAEAKSAFFNAGIEKAKSRKDPWCYTSGSWKFGNYSVLLGSEDDDEEILECVSSGVVAYTEHIGNRYPAEGEFYAPLCYLVDPSTDVPLPVHGASVLLTDPLQIPRLMLNWSKSGMSLPAHEVRILKDDSQFDDWVAVEFARGVPVLVDPLFDQTGNLAKGLVVEPIPDVDV